MHLEDATVNDLEAEEARSMSESEAIWMSGTARDQSWVMFPTQWTSD
ncbi:MAG: hypothetical protein ACXVRN_10510 [Solirubrobacteraceae bacterium]